MIDLLLTFRGMALSFRVGPLSFVTSPSDEEDTPLDEAPGWSEVAPTDEYPYDFSSTVQPCRVSYLGEEYEAEDVDDEDE